jgi:hypothetical protein
LSAFSSFDFCLSELDGEERDIQSFDFFFFLRKNEGALNFFPIISCFEKLAGEDNEDAGEWRRSRPHHVSFQSLRR